MAFSEAQPGETWEGVLHKLTADGMAELDKVERGYLRTPATCRLYDGSTRPCTVYTKNPEMAKTFGQMLDEENNPTERYVDIITRGMREVGVKQEAIDALLARPCQPRKKAHEFEKLPVPVDTPSMTMAEFRAEAANGRFLTVFNGKVTEWRGPQEGPFWERTKEGFGKDQTFDLAKNLYEPLYGNPSSFEEMTAEHRAWAEDLLCDFGKRLPTPLSVVVAVISDYPPAPDA